MTIDQHFNCRHVTRDMSHFKLRDALAGSGTSSQFSGRVADVFAGLGSGQVKSDKDTDERMKNVKGVQLTR